VREFRWRDKVIDVRHWYDFVAANWTFATGEERGYYEDASGQSGEKNKNWRLRFSWRPSLINTDIAPTQAVSKRFHFVVVDEMLSKMDDRFAEYGLELFPENSSSTTNRGTARRQGSRRRILCGLLFAGDEGR